MALVRNLFGFEGRSFATVGVTGPEVSLISDTQVRSGFRSCRVTRAVASSAATGFEHAFTSMGATDGQTMTGRCRFFLRLRAYPSANDCRVGGWSGQRATRMELDTTGHFRLYSDWITGFTTAYSTAALALNTWYEVEVRFFHSRVGATDSTTADVIVTDVETIHAATSFGGALPTFNVDRVIFGNNPAGGPLSTYDMLFDDIVFWIGSDADAATVLAGLPTKNAIVPVIIGGQGSVNTFSGSFADVDEIPMNGADFQDGDNGESTLFTPDPIAGPIDAIKWVANATITSGTQVEALAYNGVDSNLTLTTATGSDNNQTPSLAFWETVTPAVFNAREFGMRSIVAGQVVRLFNMFGEALGELASGSGAGGIGGGGGFGGGGSGGSGIGGGTGGPAGGPSGGPAGGGGGDGLGAMIGVPRIHLGD